MRISYWSSDVCSSDLRSRWFEPPFGGEAFTHMLLDAFQAMDIGERGPPLIPPGQPLDLFVTVTDLAGYPEQLSLHSPPRVEETEHRLDIGRASCRERVCRYG